MNNLPVDLVEEILSRVPVQSIRAVRSTCKRWNVISKDERFANKHIGKAAAEAREKDFLMIRTVDSMDNLHNANLYETHNKNFGLSINRKGISIARSNQTHCISQVFVSNGLLLCVWRNDDRSRLLVWNPYWGKRRWIECPTTYCLSQRFAFGYDKSCGSHKIVRYRSNNSNSYMDIYDVSSGSWRTLDATFDRNTISYIEPGLSVKGNTYWYAIDFELSERFLHCFDFTSERFEQRLPLPPCSYSSYTVSLSSVKEEKLAMLFAPWNTTYGIYIWVTNKIEPYAVSWSKFFKVETMQHIQTFSTDRFFIDEEKKVTVVFDLYNYAYVISGESGHFRKVDLTKSLKSGTFRLVGCYVPSSVQI